MPCMDLGKFLVSVFIFVFAVLFFPEMNDAVIAVSASEALKPFLLVLPTVFIAVVGIFPIYYSFSGGN